MISVKHISSGSKLHFTVTDSLTIKQFKEFRYCLEHTNTVRNNVIFDFSCANYIDCSALGMILITQDRIAALKGSLSLVLPKADNNAHKVLRAANFHKKFKIISTTYEQPTAKLIAC